MNQRITWLGIVLLVLTSVPVGGCVVRGQVSHVETVGEETSVASLSPVEPEREIDELTPVAVPQPSEKALRYYHSGLWLWFLDEVWALVVPAIILFTGLSARIRDLAQRLGRGWFFTIGLYVVLYLALVYVVDWPLAFYQGYLRQHAYGLSNQTFAKWMTDRLLSLGVSMVAGFAFAWVPYLLLARSPRNWWLYTAILSVPFLFFTVLIKPVWIDPLFNKFGPMKNQELERSILDLAGRVGIEGSRVFEVDKSVDTKAVNAYVTGFLQTKRIVLWDTLIDRLGKKELLFVMAHEMGHYVLGHVVRSILLSSIITLIGLYFVDRVGRLIIRKYSSVIKFKSLADIASVPLFLMLLQISSVILAPVAYSYSRYQEHEADRFALDLTRTNHSGATSFTKLQQTNLSNPRPGLVYKIFRATHPSIGERIDFCNSYRPGGEPVPETGPSPDTDRH